VIRAWQFSDGVGADALRLNVMPAVVCGAADVVVSTRAVALNYRDLVVARGGYQSRVPHGAVPCSDAAGVVVATGADVVDVRVGDRVTSTFAPGWIGGRLTRAALKTTLGSGMAPGVLAEQFALPASAVMPIIDGLSFEEAATLPCAALTAWHALFEVGGCGPGTSVLTLGTGGVSLFAMQFAHHAGATIIGTTSDPGKFDHVPWLRLAHIINYRDVPQWGDRVRSLSDREEGVDIVVEVGGHGTLVQSMRAVRPGGTIALIGTLAGSSPLKLSPLFLRGIRLQGITVGSRAMYGRMNEALARWSIRPVIDRIFSFDDVPAAYRRLASGEHVGKVVIKVGDDG